MQPKAIIRCQHLHIKSDAIMRGSKVKVAVCNGIEKTKDFFQNKLKEILEMYKFSLDFKTYENVTGLLEEQQEQDIIFYLLKASVEEELEATDEIKKCFKNTKIIFVAEDGKYLKEAYKVQPFRYLFLSDSKEEVQEALVSAINSNKERRGLVLEGKGKYYYILLRDILYIEALGDEIGIFTIEGMEYILRMSLKHMFFLIEDEFIRLNRQQIVNARHIVCLYGGEAKLVNNVKIVISGRERKNVAEKYTEYIWRKKL